MGGGTAWGEFVPGDSGQIITQSLTLAGHAHAISPPIEVLLIESGEPRPGSARSAFPAAAPALTSAIAASSSQILPLTTKSLR
jgi:hypothetical protein